MNEQNQNPMEEPNIGMQSQPETSEKKKQKKDKDNRNTFLLLAIIILLILLLFHSCGASKNNNELPTPQGNVEVGGKQDLTPADRVQPAKDVETITFSGYGKVNISADSPKVELSNPENNKVAFIFQLVDDASGETIATTGAVNPSEYAYVDVYDFYKDSAAGEYDVTVNITTQAADGQQMNGMSEAMQVNVIK